MDSGLIWSVAARLPKVYKALELLRMDHGAFSQLTRQYMTEDFNPRTPDKDGVRYVQQIFLVIELGLSFQILLLRGYGRAIILVCVSLIASCY